MPLHITHSKTVHAFENTEAISTALDAYVSRLQTEAIARHGIFTIAISGGSLPKILAAKLKNNKSFDYANWHVFFADERCVPLTSDDSNYASAKRELLDHVPVPAEQIYVINPDMLDAPEDAADDYMEKLKDVFAKKNSVKVPCFDLILLGTGPDGHTASLFPGHPLLKEELDWVSSLTDSPKPPPARITLTLPVLNHAHNVAFVAAGAEKQQVLHNILDDQDEELPAALVKPVSLVWFLDNAAAAKLTNTQATAFKL